MAADSVQEITQQVSVSIKGKFRRTAIAVEATGIGLRTKDGAFVGEKTIPLADPIEVVMTFKGAKGADYELTMKINGKEKKCNGVLDVGGVNVKKCTFTFSDFDL